MDNLHIKKSHIRDRNGIAYIDCNTSLGRLRFSSGEPYKQESLADIASRIKELCISFLQGQKASLRATSTKQENLADIQTLGESFLRTRCGHLKPQSLKRYESHLRLIAQKIPYEISLLNQAGYEQIVRDMAKEHIDMLNRLIAYAKEAGVLSTNIIVKRHRKLALKEPDIKPLNLQEAEAVLRACESLARDDKKWLEVRNYLGFAIFSGARLGEILALEVSDIDLENDKVYICKSKERLRNAISTTKTGKARYIDLLENAKLALQSQIALRATLKRKHNRLFTLDEKELAIRWKQALAMCGLEARVLYQTRHSFATMMLVNGEEPLWISAMLGHSSLHTTFTHYVKYMPQKRERATFVGFRLGGFGFGA